MKQIKETPERRRQRLEAERTNNIRNRPASAPSRKYEPTIESEEEQ